MTSAAERALSIPNRLKVQGAAFASMGSPLLASIAENAARDYENGGPVRAFFEVNPWAALQSLIGLRLAGALHYCALAGEAPELTAHLPSCGGDGDARGAWDAALRYIALQTPLYAERFALTPQTNEVARAMPLLGGLLAIAAATELPVRLFEIAASAGLNSRLDRFRYEGVDWQWGDAASPLVLRNRCRSGRPQHLDAALAIVERHACDLHPLDVLTGAGRLTLRSYVWADQLARLARLDAAIAVAETVPATVERADMFDWIPGRVSPREGTVTVVMQSVVMEHLLPDDCERLTGAVESACLAASAGAPMAWLRMEGRLNDYETRVTLWPGGAETPIARGNGHAQDLEWHDPGR